MLEGELIFQIGDERFTRRAGEFAFAARNVRHALANHCKVDARYLLVCTPPGIERHFVRALAPPRASSLRTGRCSRAPRSPWSARSWPAKGDRANRLDRDRGNRAALETMGESLPRLGVIAREWTRIGCIGFGGAINRGNRAARGPVVKHLHGRPGSAVPVEGE